MSVPALAGSLPDISKLDKGQTTYQQVVDAYGRPASARKFADGHIVAFYIYNAPDPRQTDHGGFFHSLVNRVKSTVKAGARGVIQSHTDGLGAAARIVDPIADNVTDSVVDKLDGEVANQAEAAPEPQMGIRCVLKFDTHRVFDGGYCASQR
ncbi:MAG TPA: hypothetical protein VFJ15_08125 [Oleiagrimonas sp.]|nr:hypothetical protein [Oleiagrimonas sp.]